VTALLLLTVAGVMIVPLLSATRTLAERRNVDRLALAMTLPGLIERAAAEAMIAAARRPDPPDPGDADDAIDAPAAPPAANRAWRVPALQARRIAARFAGIAEPDDADPDPVLPAAATALDDVPGGTTAAFALVTHLDDLIAAAEGSAPGFDLRDTRDVGVTAADAVSELLRRDLARGFAGRLRFDGGVLAVIVLLGLLQVALLVRMRRLNAGLRVEIERRTESERLVREREAELQRVADQLRDARDDAEAADRAKSRFLATMSHEFRTPLNGILGFTWLIERGLQSARPEDILEDVQRIRGAGEHMLRLVSDVLDLAKIEAGMMSPEVAPFDAGVLIGEIAAAAEPLIAAGGNTLRVDAGPLGEVRTDATRLRQVLDNLLSNAGRFTDAGAVTLIARRLPAGAALPPEVRDAPAGAAGGPGEPAFHVVGDLPPEATERLVLGVLDTGAGMSPRELAAAFEEFVQVDDSTSRRHGGTGLGLALVSRFASLLGGAVLVASRSGAGTRCSVVIPADLSPPAADASPAPESLP
jgi:signal transduction histidine kinase